MGPSLDPLLARRVPNEQLYHCRHADARTGGEEAQEPPGMVGEAHTAKNFRFHTTMVWQNDIQCQGGIGSGIGLLIVQGPVG